MQFKIRPGFICHVDTKKTFNGKEVVSTNSYAEGELVDFDEATALDHLHKLEPMDAAAKALVAKNTMPPPTATTAQAVDVSTIVQATITALLAQGWQTPETAAAAAASAESE